MTALYIILAILAPFVIYIIREHQIFGKGLIMFKIPKGKHYARPFGTIFGYRRTLLTFEFEFTEDMFYLPREGESHISKICGLSFGLNHHKNSARLGYRSYQHADGTLVGELMTYCYTDGVSPQQDKDLKTFIGSVYEPGKYRCTIELGQDDTGCWWYGFHLENMESAYEDVEWNVAVYADPTNIKFPMGRLLTPFYGGEGENETAHHDTIIPVRIVQF